MQPYARSLPQMSSMPWLEKPGPRKMYVQVVSVNQCKSCKLHIYFAQSLNVTHCEFRFAYISFLRWVITQAGVKEVKTKEVRFTSTIEEGDVRTKTNQIQKFLKKGHRVKVVDGRLSSRILKLLAGGLVL